MTTKTLNGNYPSGYTLKSTYSAVNITRYAYLQGSGLITQALATVTTAGTIRATGTYGGIAINLALGGVVTNSGGVRGNLGARGTSILGRGAPGGSGGAGLKAGASATVTNTNSFYGGYGGQGGANTAGGFLGGSGGSGGAGVQLAAGGNVTNTTGTIRGGHGGLGGTDSTYTGGRGGTGGAGIYLQGAGTVTVNGGAIIGGVAGAGGFGKSTGQTGATGAGVLLTAGGSVVDHALISGGTGVYARGSSAVTVTNFGNITGSGGTAVFFQNSSDRLIDEAGAVFTGSVAGGGGTLELAAGTGTIATLGTAFTGFNSYVVDAGGIWTLTGANTLAANRTLTNFGTLIGSLGLGATTDRLVSGSASKIVGSVAGGSGTLELAAATGTISGLGAAGTLSGAEAMTFSGFGSYLFDSGDSWTLAGANTIQAGASLTNLGALTVGGTLSVVGALFNRGSITAAAGDGVILTAGAVTNGSTAVGGALITGVVGVYAGSSSTATVTNFGMIQGTGGVAVQFKSAGDRLIAETGSHFLGAVQGGGGTLELASAAGAITGLGGSGTITGAEGITFSGFGSYIIDSGGSWTLTGSNTVASGRSLTNNATVTNNGILTVAGSLANQGALMGAAGVPGLLGSFQNNNGINGGAGSVGVNLAAGGAISNGGTIVGGQGGAGGYNSNTGGGNHGVPGAGGAGGAGLVSGGGASVTNSNVVRGGDGGAGGAPSALYASAAGGAGGIGVDLLGGATLTVNGGLISGGHGGAAGGASGGAAGVVGGAGVYLLAGGTVILNSGAIAGGGGGSGAIDDFGSRGSAGGAGGAGLVTKGPATLNTAGSIQGGIGGAGGSDNEHFSDDSGAVGGTGGAGVDLSAAGSVANSGSIGGGQGGAGGDGYQRSGGGGGGGVGVDLRSGGSISNSGMILGGKGGGGGTNVASSPRYGASGVGGRGGVGVALLNGGFLATTGGAVGGGAGGAAGAFLAASGGAGGVGVYLLSGGTVTVTAGQIYGGTGAAGATNLSGLSGGGAGGAGGTAIAAVGAAAVNSAGVVSGGAGGAAGGNTRHLRGTSGTTGAAGGAGGAAIDISAAGAVANTGEITGGQGGQGGYGYQNAGGQGGAGGVGVELRAGGQVTNSGVILGGSGAGGGADYLGNGGGGGAGGSGAVLLSGGAILNTGSIEGGQGGAGAAAGGQFGSPGVSGSAGVGVSLTAGGLVTNGSNAVTTALIAGFIGVYAGPGGAATVTNFGTIQGTDGVAVQFKSSVDSLNVEGGSHFIGALQGGGGTLVLDSGTGTVTGLGGVGTLSGDVSASFSGFATYNISPGANWTIAGSGTMTANQGLNAYGAMTIGGVIAGAGNIYGPGRISIAGSGTIDANAATDLLLDAVGNTIVNAGLIEATGAGGLTIRYAQVDDSSGGALLAGNGSIVRLQRTSVIGGALLSVGTGEFKTYLGGPSTLDGRAFAVDNHARVIVQNSTALIIEGSIIDTGRIALTSFGAATTLTIGAAGATLTGGGAIITSDNANNIITGASSAATLTNVDNTIDGAGALGNGALTLVNEAKGVIVDPYRIALVIDTGANAIVNAGLIVAKGMGGMIVQSGVANSGILESDGGTLTVDGAVTGTGSGMVYSGTLDFTSSFTQNVVFQKTTGVLELAQAQNYSGTITGFSKTGGTSLDLRDIGFVSSTEATFSGTASGGVLTVTDGTHTALITLRGDYLGSTFTAGSDGHGGTTVVDPNAPVQALVPPTAATPAHQFIAAMAGLGASPAMGSSPIAHNWREPRPMLVGPRASMA